MKCQNVMKVVLVKLVAGVEFDHPLDRNALYWPASNRTFSSQRPKRILNSKNVLTRFIERERVEVDYVSPAVAHHEVAVPGIVSWNVLITSFLEKSPQLWHIGMSQRYIQIQMRPRLFT